MTQVRVIQRNLVYIINLNEQLAEESVLAQNSLFGQYGKIKSISVKNNSNINRKNYGSPVYSAYITFSSELEASVCIGSMDGSLVGRQRLGASYGMTKYCSFYLDDQTCRNENCVFLHKSAASKDSFSLFEKHTRGYPTRPSKKEIFEFIETFSKGSIQHYEVSSKKIQVKMRKQKEQFNVIDFRIPSNGGSESESDNPSSFQLPSPLVLIELFKEKRPDLFDIKSNVGIERENLSVKPNILKEEVNQISINKSWHFSSVKPKMENKIVKRVKKQMKGQVQKSKK